MATEDYLWIDPQFVGTLRANQLDGFDALMQTPGAHRMNKPGLATWRERIELQLETPQGHIRCFLKRYTRPPWRAQLARKAQTQPSTASVEWHWLKSLADLGIRVPTPLACGYRRSAGYETASLLITAEMHGDALERWLPDHCSALSRSEVRQLSSELADTVQRLHGAGLVHRDLYLAHVFVHRQPHCWNIGLIDLQRVLHPRWRKRRWIVKDLASLNHSTPAHTASTADRLRWFKKYLGTRRLDAGHRRLIVAIQNKTRRIARHSRKHGL
jgi:tRNA A-37 threonylcarbamoyl transferase component Bud32